MLCGDLPGGGWLVLMLTGALTQLLTHDTFAHSTLHLAPQEPVNPVYALCDVKVEAALSFFAHQPAPGSVEWDALSD